MTAYAAAILAFGYALISLYWALGGHALVSTVGGYVEQFARRGGALPVLIALAATAAKAAGGLQLARPGGWVASMEPDTEHGRCHPPHPAFDRLCEIFTVAFRRNGADPWIGRRVPELFRRAGLEDVQVEARVQMYPPGNSRLTIRPDLVRAMRPSYDRDIRLALLDLGPQNQTIRSMIYRPRKCRFR